MPPTRPTREPRRGPRPTVDLVRRATDHAVLDCLTRDDELTRPELAARTGVSKVTISESIRRLTEKGLVEEAGTTRGGRGRTSLTYRLADAGEVTLAAAAGPGEIRVEAVDASGRAHASASHPVGLTVRPEDAPGLIDAALAEVRAASGRDAPSVVLSVADPVDADGRVLDFEGSPFIEGAVDLRPLLGPSGRIDNDVNWAALAELHEGAARDLHGFAYVYLGAGLGGALVANGAPVTGDSGVAGELGYALTVGPGGRAMSLLACFAELGLTVAGTTVIDVEAVRRGVAEEAVRGALATALGSSIATLAAMTGTTVVVLGGPWADAAGLLEAVEVQANSLLPWSISLRPARVGGADAPFVGARIAAAALSRAALFARVG